jgi:hypothetical protein
MFGKNCWKKLGLSDPKRNSRKIFTFEGTSFHQTASFEPLCMKSDKQFDLWASRTKKVLVNTL